MTLTNLLQMLSEVAATTYGIETAFREAEEKAREARERARVRRPERGAPPADWVDKAEESSKRPPTPTQLETGARPKKNRHESLI